VTDKGIDLVDVYPWAGSVLTGAARIAQESQEKSSELMRKEEIERKKRELEHKRAAVEAQITALRSEFEAAQKK